MSLRRARAVVFAVAVMLAVPLAAAAAPFSSLVVFGDSLSDNGNLYAATGYPPAPYYQGRFSNGPVAVERVAQKWGIPLLDFAVGGATTGANTPNMLAQLASYQVLSGGTADPNALYFVWGGPNDVFQAPAGGQVAALNSAAANIGTIVNTLFGMGATHVLVGGMPDLGLTPSFALAGNALLGTNLTNYYNNLLLLQLAATPVRFFDSASTLRNVTNNPAAYGLSNVTAPCFNGVTVCASPDSYLYWDGVHPTAAAHEITADALAAAAVPEPATLVMVASGLALGLRRYRRR